MTTPAGNAIELVSNSPEQTRAWGAALARELRAGEVVALVGHLGAGKTQWVKGLATGLGINPDGVHSPTFTLINEYAGPTQASLVLYHIDAYRLSGPAELEALGLGELLEQADGIVAIEWADRVAGIIPPGAFWVEGSMPAELSANQRRYRISGPRVVRLA